MSAARSASRDFVSIAVHPHGPFLYMSFFGAAADTLQAFQFDWLSGALTPIGLPIPIDSDTEAVAMYPTGDAIHLASPNTLTVRTFSIDRATGLLTATSPPLPIHDGGNALAVLVTPRSGFAGLGVPLAEKLEIRGGTPPYTFAITEGALPAGVSIDSASGTLSGTPTAAGTTSYVVRATDSRGFRAYQT